MRFVQKVSVVDLLLSADDKNLRSCNTAHDVFSMGNCHTFATGYTVLESTTKNHFPESSSEHCHCIFHLVRTAKTLSLQLMREHSSWSG
jgi:hypothetical protein